MSSRAVAVPLRPFTVAALGLVALVGAAGCGDDGEDHEPLSVAVSDGIDLVATEMSYDPDEVVVLAGTVDITLRNEGTILHDLRVAEEPFILEANAGEVDTKQVKLEPGFYELYCSLPGHREAGMEGVLEVREA